jgi:aryl-alcohol dehydrogenase-like predicted oxidoreductase
MVVNVDLGSRRRLNSSLDRTKFDHVDLIYANPPPSGLDLPEMVASVLFGATSPAQVVENTAALEIDAATVRRIAA